ncbi:MAG: Radical SAM domain protein [Magnetococcales bacterium]|nr:Radical SAM domain protein [Magnetococcales bacterium]
MITLINPPGIKSLAGLQIHAPNPPLGLAYIAAVVKQSGRPCTVIDATGLGLDVVGPYPGRDDLLLQGLPFEHIVQRIPDETDVIGVTCTFSSLWPLTRHLIQDIRKRFPKVLIVVGGEHVTALAEHTLTTSPVDIVVMGEGEETFLNLLTAHENKQDFLSIGGIAFLRDGRMVSTGLSLRNRNIDALPLPDWDAIPIGEYIDRAQTNGINLGRSMPIMMTRGCPYRCSFCSSPGMWTTRYVPRDPVRIVDEMAMYIKKYNVRNFDSQDLTAIVKRSWVIHLCREIIDRRLNITWQMPTGTRSEVFDVEVIRLLYQSGCRLLSFAPESGSVELLKSVQKQVDLTSMERAIRVSLQHGFKVSCFFVIGFPNETKKTLGDTMTLIRRLAWIGVHDVTVTKFVPYPGSLIFREINQIKLNDEFFISPMDFYTANAPSYAQEISSRSLYHTMLWMFVNFYILSFILRPFRVMKILWIAITTGEEQTKYAKWFRYRFLNRNKWRKALNRQPKK